MIPEGETRDEFRYNIGTSLFKMSKDPRLGEDWMLLAAADHLNATFTKDPLFLAKLNLEAGEKCISVAAFAAIGIYGIFNTRSTFTWVRKVYSTAADSRMEPILVSAPGTVDSRISCIRRKVSRLLDGFSCSRIFESNVIMPTESRCPSRSQATDAPSIRAY